MKKNIYAICAMLLFLGFAGNSIFAQCNSAGGTNAGSINPANTFQTITVVDAGSYYTFSGLAGTVYTFSFCNGGGAATYDTQITITDNAGNPVTGGYNDDFCGLQSEVSWTCSVAATYRVYITQFSCATNSNTNGTLAYRLSAPPAGGYCTTAIPVPSLPFNLTNQTTCGKLDLFSSTDACGSSYMNGDDMVFTYTSTTANEVLDITLSNSATWMGVFVTLGCPDDASSVCIQSGGTVGACGTGGTATNTNSAGNPSGSFTLPTPGTYYIIVSTFPSPQCGAFDINIQAGTPSASSAGVGCYNTGSISYAPDPYNTGTLLSFPDDRFSGIVPIGFTFCFMGNQYNSMVVSSNGYVTFETVCATEFSSYTITSIPTTSEDEILNSILGCWQDIDPGVGGEIRYSTLGTSPNRRTVVNFNNIPMFSASCNSLIFTGQIVMYETTNIIEVNIANKPICTSWQSGNAVQGLLDASGTVAVPIAGRNNSNWSVSNDAVRFTPTCDVCNIILPVSYLNFAGKATEQGNLIQWDTHIEDALAGFVLERSPDGQSFDEVAYFDAMASQGQGYNYEFLDADAFRPQTFYRLREIDQDGNVSFSEVISVQPDADQAPVRNVFVEEQYGMLAIEIEVDTASQFRFDILDAMGKVLYSAPEQLVPGRQTLRIDVSQFAAGYYILRTSDNQRFFDARKFVISK